MQLVALGVTFLVVGFATLALTPSWHTLVKNRLTDRLGRLPAVRRWRILSAAGCFAAGLILVAVGLLDGPLWAAVPVVVLLVVAESLLATHAARAARRAGPRPPEGAIPGYYHPN